MPSSSRLPRAFFALAVFLLSMTGCRPAMSDQTASRIEPPAPTREVPLRFVRHNFAAHCYNAIGCRIGYDGRYSINDEPDKISGPPPADKKAAWGSVDGSIRNFPPPAEVRWKSLDGVPHEAKVDFAAIFKDGLIWHNVPKADMADFYRGPVAGDPNIHLEVNDHTINVYMMMLIPTRTEQKPGNPYSYHRTDLFLVWTHTY